jgi:AcrR family transcriptional regulator
MVSISDTKAAILSAALRHFERDGYENATVASICEAPEVSNGSFFHFFRSKQRLAAELLLDTLASYHAAMVEPLRATPPAAEGIAGLVNAHLTWVVTARRQAHFLFEQGRAEWSTELDREQQAENSKFRSRVEAWAKPLIAEGTLRSLPAPVLLAQVIGPAQIFCGAWLSGRNGEDPRKRADLLVDCAIRALVNKKDKFSDR